MKTERRHELQTNSLSLVLMQAPEWFRQHAASVLLGVVVLILAIVLLNWRLREPQRRLNAAIDELSFAQQYVNALQRGAIPASEAAIARSRIQEALNLSDDSTLQAQAYALLGDYYWNMANLRLPPQATTRPGALPEEPKDKLLERAEAAYSAALAKNSGSSSYAPAVAAAAAHFGLAAIAETRAFDAVEKGDTQASASLWEEVTKHYQQISDAAAVPFSVREQAKLRLDLLPRLQQPVLISAATQPTTFEQTITLGEGGLQLPGATTEPSFFGGTLAPLTTAPATGPVTVPPASQP